MNTRKDCQNTSNKRCQTSIAKQALKNDDAWERIIISHMLDKSSDKDVSLRHDWGVEEVFSILSTPLFALIDRARAVHRHYHGKDDVQLASLLSIKTGACPEDCKYCPQSARYSSGLEREPLMPVPEVVARAREAKRDGASRFCMGAAWRQVRDGKEFDQVLEMVRSVHDLGMETCVTLGMLTPSQARRLKQAGLSAYNHNLDTSEEFYSQIITTRTYEDRLQTLENVRQAGISVCCGGIIGMGESHKDRAKMLHTLAQFQPHPDSVPINALVAVEGTPLAGAKPVDPIDMVRMCATARIIMPQARVRLSAGRRTLGKEAQILCFLAGANSIFYGEKLLTTDNNECLEDQALLREMGLQPAKREESSTASAGE